MKKGIYAAMLVATCFLLFSGCQCKHVFLEADCLLPRTCSECGAFEGEALGHKWMDADCLSPKTCSVCKLTEGTAAGHAWADATCEAPKTCAVCATTEGDPLVHAWQDPSTSAPKTCTLCSVTEGERIITDERFTTEASSPLFGTWTCRDEVDLAELGLPGAEGVFYCTRTMTLHNDGKYHYLVSAEDPEGIIHELINVTMDMMLEELQEQGLTLEQIEAQFVMETGMSIQDFYMQIFESMGLMEMLESTEADCVYYVDADQLYSGETWDDMSPVTFRLEGDTLTCTHEDGKVRTYDRIG